MNHQRMRNFANAAVCSAVMLLSWQPAVAFARSKSAGNFGAARGLIFYTAPELSVLNERLGNSPRLTADKEFGRALTHAARVEFLDVKETKGWGIEAQHWAETLRARATSGDGDPRSEATLAFLRLWFSGSVRLWPWIGPLIVKRNTNIFGHSFMMNKARPIRGGLFSYAYLSTGPLFWRHDYFLSDSANQTAINYATRTLSWEGSVRWTLGYRLGGFCDVGIELAGSRSRALRGESAVGQFFLSGRDNNERTKDLHVDTLSKAAWRSSQALMFIRFFYP